MESISKCDVEISVTFDGMETTESVPKYLQEAFLTSSSAEPDASRNNHVKLPKRFAQFVKYPGIDSQMIGTDMCGEETEDREKDVTTALKWIKEEMVLLKEQDKCLLKQLIALRSKILHLQCVYQPFGTFPNISLSDSTCFLDENHDGPYLGDPDLDMTEFRSRTSSLLEPEHKTLGPVTRIKWKSHEYL